MVGHRYSSLCDLVHMPCSWVVDAAVIELELKTPADFPLHTRAKDTGACRPNSLPST